MLNKNDTCLTYIQNEKSHFNLVQRVQESPNKIQNIGLSIYRRTLEINNINEDKIEFLLNTKSDSLLIPKLESKVNIGFLNIRGITCFLYCNNSDIEEKGIIDFAKNSKIYKIKNIRYIPIYPYLTPKGEYNLNIDFDKIKKFLLEEGLYFSTIPYRLNFDFKGQIESSNYINYKYKLNENFQYNEDFSPKLFKNVLTPIITGYFKSINHSNHSNEKGTINIVMRYKLYNNNYYFIEIEIFIPPTQNNQEIYQIIFYAYFNDSNNANILNRLIDDWFKNLNSSKIEDNESKFGIIINCNNNPNNLTVNEIKTLSNFDIININKEDIQENFLIKLDRIKNIGYNYRYNKIDYNSQNKLLILVSDDLNNLFQMIQIVSIFLFSIFLKDRKYKPNIINNLQKDFNKTFKKAEKNLNSFIKSFPKRIPINKINDIYFELIQNNLTNKKEEKEDNNFDLDFDKNININKIEQNEINDNSIKLYIGTYNVNALNPDLLKSEELSPFLFPEKLSKYFSEEQFPTFYCIGLEEIVELNTKNIFGNSADKDIPWIKRISMEIQKKYNYFLICKKRLVGILFLFFVKSSELKYIKNLHTGELSKGFMGRGNKGCCFLEFEYKEKHYGFCSCHLPAGENEKNLKSRQQIFNEIFDFKVDKTKKEFRKNDFYFIFGDLNFRTVKFGLIYLKNHIKIISSNKKAEEENYEKFTKSVIISKEKPKLKKIMKQKTQNIFDKRIKNNDNKIDVFDDNDLKIKSNLNNYLTKDDFHIKKKIKIDENIMDEDTFKEIFLDEFMENEELKKFKETELEKFGVIEGKITFPPTYKYKKNTNYYNISKRVPSWTDRILYRNNDNITLLEYDKIDINFSDHKPIFGLFEIQNKVDDE